MEFNSGFKGLTDIFKNHNAFVLGTRRRTRNQEDTGIINLLNIGN